MVKWKSHEQSVIDLQDETQYFWQRSDRNVQCPKCSNYSRKSLVGLCVWGYLETNTGIWSKCDNDKSIKLAMRNYLITSLLIDLIHGMRSGAEPQFGLLQITSPACTLRIFLDSLANHFNINTAISSFCWLLRLTIIQWAGRLLVFSLTHSAKLHGQEVQHYFGKQVSVSRLEQDRDPLNNYLHFFAVIFIRRWTLN